MSMAAVAPEYEDPQASLFGLDEIGYNTDSEHFSVKTGKAQQLADGETLKVHQVVRGSFVGEVLAFGWRDGKLTWEITATEVNLG